ncbi:type IV pilus twitching motility protein PilT [Chromobacterium piscinae]|uniref:type IV pilus twitching motility protein PilT n=1 Tax=Chromobacterium piscinae TaxID=686831 RepID=UPI001E494285|nr:type IV pilus twitching motility protein PilT [Chromobacterium piscinae]MCD5327954.1 type IV pilus twitching motility protein PilT [Chromobacterium piscinae]
MELNDLFELCVQERASDIHLSAGYPPMLRQHGEIRYLGMEELLDKHLAAMLEGCMSPTQQKSYERSQECDFALETNHGRFRANTFFQQRGKAAVFRHIPNQVPTLEELKAPAVLRQIAEYPRGLVLVTGPAGAGKSTTCAAMLDWINETRAGHILTIEDPIEFIHPRKKCIVNQRELGAQTSSFARALKSALREDPNVIMIGELRDLETIRLALTAAETGHLVFGTLHTSGAAKAVDRIIDVFPAGEKELVRSMLAGSLRAIVSQILPRNKQGNGRVAAHEILVGTSAVRNLIRENKLQQMAGLLQTGKEFGMQTLDQSLQELVCCGVVSLQTARTFADDPTKLAGG